MSIPYGSMVWLKKGPERDREGFTIKAVYPVREAVLGVFLCGLVLGIFGLMGFLCYLAVVFVW